MDKIIDVALLQFEIKKGDIESNLDFVCTQIDKKDFLPGSILLLPELWATGFDYLNWHGLAEKTPSVLAAVARLSKENNIVIVGSLPELVEDSNSLPYNTMFVIEDGQIVGRYRKQHLFSFWHEDRFFIVGNNPAPMQVAGARAGGLICYDLRFPGLASIYGFAGVDFLLVSAQWPEARIEHWQSLLKARAIENQFFVLAANGCGKSGEHELGGCSMVVAPDGRVVAGLGGEPGLLEVKIDLTEIERARKNFCSVGERPWLKEDAGKLCTLSALEKELSFIRKQGSKIVFTNGCFDLLHAGHVSYLEKARSCGELLVVGLNSDSSVRGLKGAERPVNNESDRARVLSSLGCVDFVVIFSDETPLNLIKVIRPDVLVKGADWQEDEIAGAKEVKSWGGRVERIIFEHDCSTSKTIDRIRQ